MCFWLMDLSDSDTSSIVAVRMALHWQIMLIVLCFILSQDDIATDIISLINSDSEPETKEVILISSSSDSDVGVGKRYDKFILYYRK